MYKIGPVEKTIYKLRAEHPLVIPQLDPDNWSAEAAKKWFSRIKNEGISVIAMGGSMVKTLETQELLDMAVKDYGLKVILYLTNNTGSIKGTKEKTAVYWMQVPNSQNTFFGWDGIISNSQQIEKNKFEPIPTVYVFDDRGYIGTANWIARSYPIPEKKPGVSLAVAKAAQYLGIRFYIMAGGSGSVKPPPVEHVEKLTHESELFVIPTSGITTVEHAKKLFAAGADAIHIGNMLEHDEGFKILGEIVKASKQYPGKNFL